MLPPIFEGDGGIKVSPLLAEVFSRFDLGEGGLGNRGRVFPIQIYLFDRITPVKTDHLLLMYGGYKDGLIPSESKGLIASKYASNPPTHWMLSEIRDDDICVSAAVLSGADLWFDPMLPNIFFMSDRLVQALRTERFDSCFKFTRCRVVEFH